MSRVIRKILFHSKKKISQSTSHGHSFSRQISSFGASTSSTPIFPKSLYAEIAAGALRAKASESISLFLNNIRLSERALVFKNINADIWSRLRYYTKPRNYYRGTNFVSPEAMVYSLIGVNVAVFFLWRKADGRFMKKNFKISVDNFLHGRVHTLITSGFSHIHLEHLFSNMICLYFFGSSIGERFGAQYLLNLYIAGAIFGSIFYLVNEAFIVPWRQGIPIKYYNSRYSNGALGASGAVNSIMLLYIFLYPKAVIYVNFFIPVPAMLLGIIYIGQDLWRVKQGNTNISGAAHLGGALVAALAWARIKRLI